MMPADKVRELAALMVEHELSAKRAEPAEALARLFEKLRDALEPMVGNQGFAAVASRAVWLTARNGEGKGFPPETALTSRDLAALIEREGIARMGKWAIAVVEHALNLLNSFIGERLTLKVVERAFPQPVKMARNSKPGHGGEGR